MIEANPEKSAALATVPPGEILLEEFLRPVGMSQAALARSLGVSPRRVADVVSNHRRLTGDMAVRPGLFFNTSPEFWMNLQSHYDIEVARDAIPPQEAASIASRRAA